MDPGIVGPERWLFDRRGELAVEHPAQRAATVGGERGRELVIAEARVLLFLDKAGVLEQAEVTEDARLREPRSVRRHSSVRAREPAVAADGLRCRAVDTG